MTKLCDKITIIGVGLIGGSFGMALSSQGLANLVTGFDIDQENLDLALETQAINNIADSLEEAVSEADLVVIATPVGLTIDYISKIAPLIKKGCIVTDVGSTKSKITQAARQLMPLGTFFVGGHPMTGSEVTGVRGADRYLFENAVYILTPTVDTDLVSLEKIRQLVISLGSKVIEILPEDHDLMVAGVSHLPHLVATALVNTVGEIQKDYKDILMLAAGGFRDTTRVASGHPLMWRDICLTNKESIIFTLDKFGDVLAQMRSMIEKCDDKGIESVFDQARNLRQNIPAKLRGYLPVIYEIVVTVPDHPGIIASLASLLGNEGINICDIEILRVREGEGGTIRLAFSTEEEQLKAVERLRKNNITVQKRLK